MSLLILGGTNEALRLAGNLHEKGIPIIYSLAGIVRTPKVDFTVITGGFSQYGGLRCYINNYFNNGSSKDKNGHVNQTISGIIDATHPYASVMSEEAYSVALANDLSYWQFNRPAWKQHPEDRWFEYKNWNELLTMVNGKESLFITTGQLDAMTLGMLEKDFLSKTDAKIVLRTAVEPASLEQGRHEKIHYLQAIGPFSIEDEVDIMRKYGVDALVSKNSGGKATIAKLQAARQLQIPVYLLQRPENPAEHQRVQNAKMSTRPDSQIIFSDVNVCEEHILQHFHQSDSKNNSKIQ